MVRRLLSLLAALLTLLAAAPVAALSRRRGPGIGRSELRLGFVSAAPGHARAAGSGSPCTHGVPKTCPYGDQTTDRTFGHPPVGGRRGADAWRDRAAVGDQFAAGLTSVWAKSSPLKRSVWPIDRASAYEKQSP